MLRLRLFTTSFLLLVGLSTTFLLVVPAQGEEDDPLDFLDGGAEYIGGGGGGGEFLLPEECQTAVVIFALCFQEHEDTCGVACNDLSDVVSDASSTLPSGSSVACSEVEANVCTFSLCCPDCSSEYLDFISCLSDNQQGACSFDCGGVQDDSSSSSSAGKNQVGAKQGFILSMMGIALALLL